MKRIQYHSYGGPEVMRLEEFALGTPGKDEVAVAVRRAALNPIDWKVRNGAMKIVTGRSFPRGMGLDLAGTVTAVGADVTRFKIGDAVFGMARFKEPVHWPKLSLPRKPRSRKSRRPSPSSRPHASGRRASRLGMASSTRRD